MIGYTLVGLFIVGSVAALAGAVTGTPALYGGGLVVAAAAGAVLIGVEYTRVERVARAA